MSRHIWVPAWHWTYVRYCNLRAGRFGADHFRHEHYLCNHQTCLDRKFIVFMTEQELKQHAAREHGGDMSKAERRQALTIPINFQVRCGVLESLCIPKVAKLCAVCKHAAQSLTILSAVRYLGLTGGYKLRHALQHNDALSLLIVAQGKPSWLVASQAELQHGFAAARRARSANSATHDLRGAGGCKLRGDTLQPLCVEASCRMSP